jgi:hypothetical protein
LGDPFSGAIEGKLTQSGFADTQDPYSGTAHYSFANAASLDGPGAVSFEIGFRPKSLTALLDASFRARNEDYTCPSFSAVDQTTIELPRDVAIAAIPRPASLGVDGVTLSTRYERISDHAVRATIALITEHAHIDCSSDYYNRVRERLSRMAGILNAQIVYVPRSAEDSLLAQQVASGTVQRDAAGISR